MIVICTLPELVFLGSDHGLWGSARWRPLTYQYGAFWVGLLYGWRPNFAGQPYAMFLTYAFLHGGPWHLIVNMITLYSIGKPIIERIGQWRFMLLYAVSILGGAAAFALLTSTPQPMVGASGALFGLVGGWVIWEALETVRDIPGVSTLFYAMLWPVTLLVLLNVIMYMGTGGQLAWETHLGGALAGITIAPLLLRQKPTAAKG